jgi:hypothetical protein
MSTPLQQLLTASKSILILLPTNPHFDHVAAGLALYLSISQKHDATITCPSPMIVEFNRLVGVDKITPELGNKNLTITFVDYPHDQVDRVAYDIDNGQFKLTISPKPQMAAPKKEQVNLSYAGVAADSVIMVGGGHEGHFPAISSPDLKSARIAHIGTKVVTPPPPLEALSLAKQASSVSELVAQYLKDSELPIDADIATNLLLGIEEGSRGFTNQETSADTFALVAELMRAGGRRIAKSTQQDRRNFPPGAIPGATLQTPQPATPRPPKSWYEPKIYKGSGTTVS